MSHADQVLRLGYISAAGVVRPPGGHTLPIENPATGQILGDLHEVSAAEVDEIVGGATTVFRSTWRDTAPGDRGRLLARWAALISEHRDELAGLEIADVGHLPSEATGDLDSSVRILTYFAGIADKLEGRTYAQLPDRLSYELREPFGVVAGISPYNGNANFIALKAGPALVAGNCIVLKAPEVAPVLTFRLVELALDAGIPAGVINVLSGRGAVVGPLLSEHPGIGMVAFTGGPESGRAVIRQSATNIVPTFLELGGKSPAILLPDADLDTVVPSVLHSNYAKSGQSCVAGSRILVPSARYDEVTERLASFAESIRVGLPSAPESQMSTLISKTHRTHVDGLVQRAASAGASVIAGGAAATDGDLAQGAFYRPTVLRDVGDMNPAAVEEAFGPVASVLNYDDLDEAVARANATPFGLSAQIWGNDARAIQFLSRRLEAGTVWINTYRSFHPTVPFGGWKQSGFGKENGFASVDVYLRSKSVVWDLSTERELPYNH
ncbi:aldehyde dehydrogenase family protein [Microbacterium sp. ISL-103]|uniref:aldehyde dehydrogenase family protein n=1 Tax=Microbacterium sp. ISL-103 TaxID=2819156 RepID=UPI001BEB7242|nr:aldehyde dehydrogenase family protein [Microbacterium sp. ISL-103]MBT2473684.1 aldehyde dehydrogenase family protein [Microbacterium sp. ISL-103]